MDFGRLRTLRELAQRKTMAAVAEALLISPSAVSQQIALLEDEAGVTLIERRGRGVALTPAGENLVAHAQRIIAILEEARTDIAEFNRIVAGELRIAAFPSIAAALIPQTMRSVEALHPRLRILLEELEPSPGLAALRAWQTDIALIDDLSDAQDMPGEFVETIEIYEDSLVAIMPSSHRYASRDSISLGDLKDERWAVDTSSSPYANVLIGACQAAGFSPLINGRCNAFDVVSALIRAEQSIAVLPGLRMVNHGGDLIARKITPILRRKIFAAFRKGERRKPAVAAVLERLRAEATLLPIF